MNCIAILFLTCHAHGSAISPQYTELKKRSEENVIGVGGLVATIIGVLVAASGVFGWKCWRGRRRENVECVQSESYLPH